MPVLGLELKRINKEGKASGAGHQEGGSCKRTKLVARCVGVLKADCHPMVWPSEGAEVSESAAAERQVAGVDPAKPSGIGKDDPSVCASTVDHLLEGAEEDEMPGSPPLACQGCGVCGWRGGGNRALEW